MNDTSTAEGLTQLVREVLTHHMLEVALEPTFVLDPDERIVIANRAVATLGWDRSTLVGRAWTELVAGYDGNPERMLSSDIAKSAPGIALVRHGRIRRGDRMGTESMLVIAYRLWLGDAGAPSVIVLRPARTEVASGCSAAG